MLNTPFFSQRLTQENFQAEGFETWSEAQSWTKRICGLACLKMAIAQVKHQNIPLKHLLDQGLAVGGYMKGVGWIHQGLVEIAGQYGIDGSCRSIGQKVQVIDEALDQNRLVIASVSCGYNPKKKGGHLVLMIGNQNDGFITHHPSHELCEQWDHYFIKKQAFLQCFSENGNIIILSESG